MELRGFEDSPEKERSQRATRQKQQEKEKQEREREKAKKQAASEEAVEAAKKGPQLQQQGQRLSSVEEVVNIFAPEFEKALIKVIVLS